MAFTRPIPAADWPAPSRAGVGLARALLLVLGVAALVLAAGLAAYALFEANGRQRLDRQLADSAREVQASTMLRGGRLVSAWVDDPETLRAYSGVYWQVAKPDASDEPLGLTSLATSRSLWDATLPPPPMADLRAVQPGRPAFYDAPGPLGQDLRIAFVRGRAADGSSAVYLAARDTTGLRREALAFAGKVTGALGVVGLALAALLLRRKRT